MKEQYQVLLYTFLRQVVEYFHGVPLPLRIYLCLVVLQKMICYHYAIVKERKSKESFFESKDLSQNIFSNGENENWDMTNAFMRTLRLCEVNILQNLARVFSFSPAVLHVIVVCFLKLKS